MDPFSLITNAVQVSYTIYLCFEAKSENRRLGKLLYYKLNEIQRKASDFRQDTRDGAVLDIPDQILVAIKSDLSEVSENLDQLKGKTAEKATAINHIKKLNLKSTVRAGEVCTTLQNLITKVDECQRRFEQCQLATYYGERFQGISSKLGELSSVVSKIAAQNEYRDSGVEDPETLKHLGVVQTFADKFTHARNRSIESHEFQTNPSLSLASSIDIDSEEADMLEIYSNLPTAIEQLIKDLGEGEVNSECKIKLREHLKTLWVGLKLPHRNVFEYEKEGDDETIELGHGTSSTVLAGTLTQPDGKKIPVAIKKIRPFTPEHLPHFLRECFLHLIVQHHCVVRLHGMWYPSKARGKAFIILERMKCSVAQAMKAGHKFDAKEVLIDVASGLEHLHCKGVVHRDIKLENVLLNDTGPAKLSDFGSSRRKTGDTMSKLTVADGTALYMPPEVFKHPTSCRTSRKWDVYSFGILMCNMLYPEGRKTYSYRFCDHQLSEKQIAKLARDWTDGIQDIHLNVLAKWALQADPGRRPNMQDIVLHLTGLLKIDHIPKYVGGRRQSGLARGESSESGSVASFDVHANQDRAIDWDAVVNGEKSGVSNGIHSTHSLDSGEIPDSNKLKKSKPLHSCVKEDIIIRLNAAFRKRGRTVIEKEVDVREVSDYLYKLQKYCKKKKLANRFVFSPRDGTVGVKARVPNPPHHLAAVAGDSSRVSEVLIHLFTTTHDYTSNSNLKYTDGWSIGSDYDLDSLAFELLLQSFDPLQRYLLESQAAYLHNVTFHKVATGNDAFTLVFTVQIARRYRSAHAHPEPHIGDIQLDNWPHMNSFARQTAHTCEITLWAALSVTPTDERLDDARLSVIKQAIDAENLTQGSSSSISAISNQGIVRPIVVHGGNRVALLRARRAQRQDGRARFPVARAAAFDMSVVEREASDEWASSYGGEKGADAESIEDNTPWGDALAAGVPVMSAPHGAWLLLAGWVAYLLVEKATVSAFNGVRLTVVAIMFASALLLSLMMNATKQRRRSPSQSGGMRALIDDAVSPAGRQRYDGLGLSFAGDIGSYTGTLSFPKRLSLQDLFRAAYTTTFDRGGREVLVAPGRHGCTVRLQGFDEDGAAVFEDVAAAEQRHSFHAGTDAELEHEVLPVCDVVGVWGKSVLINTGVDQER